MWRGLLRLLGNGGTLDGRIARAGLVVWAISSVSSVSCRESGTIATADGGFLGPSIARVLRMQVSRPHEGGEARPALVRVQGERALVGRAGVFSYEVSVYDEGSRAWRPYCASGARALVMEGRWDARGEYVAEPASTTFACLDGVLAKCVLWGFSPWESRALHQACTRMARADYCGDGMSHTRDGTPIGFEDLADSGRVSAERWSHDWFEGVWTERGAVCLRRARQGEPLGDILRDCPRLTGRLGESVGCDRAFALELAAAEADAGVGAQAVLVSYSVPRRDGGSLR